MSFLMKRLPKREQIISVYAVGVTILYFWATLNAIKDLLSNWSLYLSVSEILGLFSYIMAGTFLESLLLIFVLLLISFILPQKIFAEKFVVRGSILTITFLSSIIYLYQLTLTFGILENINKWGIFFVSVTFILALLGELSQFFARIVESIADRCIVFLYIYLPISLISIIVIFARNVS
jgi:hypothetical protein